MAEDTGEKLLKLVATSFPFWRNYKFDPVGFFPQGVTAPPRYHIPLILGCASEIAELDRSRLPQPQA